MVREDKLSQALHAFNGVLIQLRHWAYLDEDTQKIAVVLDIVEQLPRFLSTSQDQTKEFEENLVLLAETFPKMGIGLDRFRWEQPPGPW